MSTIVFATEHDEATAANAAVARGLVSLLDIALIGKDATRHSLLTAMDDNRGLAVLLMAHGSREAVFENSASHAFAVTDCEDLRGRRVFAWACNTSLELGVAAAVAGATWIGYRCAVTAPSDHPSFLPGFCSIFAEIKSRFQYVQCAESAADFIVWLKVECEKLIEVFDEALQGCDEFSALSCCGQLWQQVDIHLPGVAAPIRHPHAPKPYLIF
ncbi:hypothetical protein [Stenotrophomonas rhizophila]|jgi:hypothetical protein|uniref:hypothetical protein n=1 Tax=Stenotrophomonas rhizophila TaxID=216778 RepID=UPI0011C454EA|nr:hypothetical protein [Stenotrophomonas rhizophila]